MGLNLRPLSGAFLIPPALPVVLIVTSEFREVAMIIGGLFSVELMGVGACVLFSTARFSREARAT